MRSFVHFWTRWPRSSFRCWFSFQYKCQRHCWLPSGWQLHANQMFTLEWIFSSRAEKMMLILAKDVKRVQYSVNCWRVHTNPKRERVQGNLSISILIGIFIDPFWPSFEAFIGTTMPKYVPCCFQCECIITDSSHKLKWFEKDFCNVECLNKYYRESIVECVECKTPLSTGRKIHVVQTANEYSESNWPLKDLIFCGSECVNRYKSKHILCAFCSKEIELETEQTSETHRMTTFCSPKCEGFMNIHLGVMSVPQAKCSTCSEIKEVQLGMLLDGIKYVACSEDCFSDFKENINVKSG